MALQMLVVVMVLLGVISTQVGAQGQGPMSAPPSNSVPGSPSMPPVGFATPPAFAAPTPTMSMPTPPAATPSMAPDHEHHNVPTPSQTKAPMKAPAKSPTEASAPGPSPAKSAGVMTSAHTWRGLVAAAGLVAVLAY